MDNNTSGGLELTTTETTERITSTNVWITSHYHSQIKRHCNRPCCCIDVSIAVLHLWWILIIHPFLAGHNTSSGSALLSAYIVHAGKAQNNTITLVKILSYAKSIHHSYIDAIQALFCRCRHQGQSLVFLTEYIS